MMGCSDAQWRNYKGLELHEYQVNSKFSSSDITKGAVVEVGGRWTGKAKGNE